MEGTENITKGAVSLVKLTVIGDKVMEDGKVNAADLGLLIDLGGVVPGLVALKDSGKELLDLDDAEHTALVAEIEAAAGEGVYSGIGVDVIAALAAVGNVVEGIRAAKHAKDIINPDNLGTPVE